MSGAASHPSTPSEAPRPNGSLEPLLLLGPTASGKSEVALALAESCGGEIVSVDSMQVYRGLDIGTAKPSAEEHRRVPHHLVDVLDLTGSFDAARFLQSAGEAVRGIQQRGRLPILCGGTGLYFKAWLAGLGKAPASDENLRAELRAASLQDLLRELAEADPETYGRIDRQNPRRVIRAVEVIRLTGKPYSAQRAAWEPEPGSAPGMDRIFGLLRDPADLRQRIDARVEDMFRRGLVEETRRLLDAGLAKNEVAMQALGYRQVVEHLQGARSLAETVELVKSRTRKFAKRQMTWFRGQLPVRWIPVGKSESAQAVAERLVAESTAGGTSSESP
jgi:tRNA dimethylallyltransferase